MERYLRVNVLGPGPRLIKKNLPGRGLTKVEKHWSRRNVSCKTIAPPCAMLAATFVNVPPRVHENIHCIPFVASPKVRARLYGFHNS